MFSPIFCTRASRASSRSPAISAAMSVSLVSASLATTLSANALKFASPAAKSVSELTSTITALPSPTTTRSLPSAAVRSAFLAALRPEFLRRSSIALSMSPPAAVSAFLHSIMPRPVRSRSSFTWAADTVAMWNILLNL